MSTSAIFDQISPSDLSRMLHCFDAKKTRFHKGETIMTYTNELEKIGIILSGKAHLYTIDYDGNFLLLEHFETDGLFGELFTLPLASLEYIVEADSDCEVLFIQYSRIIQPCSNTCHHHTQLIDNLFHLSTRKAQRLSLRINLLGAKSTRQKLLAYLSYMQKKTKSDVFSIEMSLTELAEYLYVDRSSMMRELKALKTEGILDSKGKEFTVLNPELTVSKMSNIE